jgi:chaperonin GroES
MIKFKPINDYILTKKLKYHSKSTLIQVKETTLVNKDLEVVTVSEGYNKNGKRIKLNISVGDKILVGKTAGLTIKLSNDEEYLVVKESDVIGIYEKEQ